MRDQIGVAIRSPMPRRTQQQRHTWEEFVLMEVDKERGGLAPTKNPSEWREMEDREERERTRSSGWREEKGNEERKRGERPKSSGALGRASTYLREGRGNCSGRVAVLGRAENNRNFTDGV